MIGQNEIGRSENLAEMRRDKVSGAEPRLAKVRGAKLLLAK